MDVRQQRGQFIAEAGHVEKLGNEWFVPSQSGSGKYIVRLNPDLPTCTCPDYELREMKCKHILYAARTGTFSNRWNLRVMSDSSDSA